MSTFGAQARLTNKKGVHFASIAVCPLEFIYPERKIKSYGVNLNFPNSSGGLLLTVDEANKLASEILRTTRNLPKK